MSIRAKMCDTKVSFRTKAAALKRAAVHDQRVYECPICFCWHCTSKKDWKDEFIRKEKLDGIITNQVNQAIVSKNKKITEKNKLINELQRENKRLKKILNFYRIEH